MEEYKTIDDLLFFVLIECGDMCYDTFYREEIKGDNCRGHALEIGEISAGANRRNISLPHIIYAIKLAKELFDISFNLLDLSCATEDEDYDSIDVSEMKGLLVVHFGKVKRIRVPNSVIEFTNEYDIDYPGFSKSNSGTYYKYARL